MSITTTRKSFLLAGFETQVDFSQDVSEQLMSVRSKLQSSLEKIENIVKPTRLVGFWQPNAKYFFGIELQNLDGIPADFIVKSLPESEYAVYRESCRGTAPKAEMYSLPGYTVNPEIAGDFEIFDDFNHLGETDSCDVLVPIKPKD
jgi:Uncharacterized protein conserved in bacteria